MSIRVLDDLTVNQIAAGEVIERPASVVKELIENALDAGAGEVEVTLSGEEITVRDDGCGMSPGDLRIAAQRHATSKIRDAGDLFALRSYGFRGEALPSIAAVSELEIRSRRAQDDVGHRLVISGGEGGPEEPVAMPPGTLVAVRRLFYNTPVRARFLKSDRTETGRSVAAVQRLALARSDVAFRCAVDGRLSLHTPGTGNLREAVLALFGLEVARDVREVQVADAAGRTAVALVGGPATALAARRRQGVWVNGRPVSVPGILEAAERAYPFGVLPGRRHPLLLLFLRIPPAEVDANVHPTKAEVRLQRPDNVFALVVNAVRETARPERTPPAGVERRPAAAGDGYPGYRGPAADEPVVKEEAAWFRAEPLPRALAGLRPLGQSGGRWIACDGPGGLYVIDQHAAHERVLFEELSRREERAAQPLAVPVSVDFSPAEFETWLEHRPALAQAGLGLEHFGERTVLVREVPLWAVPPASGSGAPAVRHLLADLLAELAGERAARSALPGHLRVKRALAGCLAAVKSRDRLSSEEMEALVSALAACAEPWRCPHGRPTVIFMSHEELSRRLGR